VLECIMKNIVIFGRCALRREDARTSQLLGGGMR
jgi:hypothetical protein